MNILCEILRGLILLLLWMMIWFTIAMLIASIK